MTLFQVSYLLLWTLAIALVPISAVLLYLLAQLEDQFKREGTGYGNNLIGRKLPTFSAKDPSSGAVRDIHQFPNRIHVILALSPDCTTCRSLMKELSSTASSDLARIRLFVLCMGDLERCKAAVADVRSVPVLVHDEKGDSTSDLWFVGFPAALVIDESGVVVDVRHPLSVKGVIAAVENATVSGRYLTPTHASSGH